MPKIQLTLCNKEKKITKAVRPDTMRARTTEMLPEFLLTEKSLLLALWAMNLWSFSSPKNCSRMFLRRKDGEGDF